MNIFSNIGITELIVILLLALLVVGPERLPEMGRTLAKTLRDLRKAYENLTKDLGPELMSIQETTKELRESVESITSIPQDMVSSVVKAADLDDTIDDLKQDLDSLQRVGRTVSDAGKMIKNPVGTAVDTARDALLPKSDQPGEVAGEPGEKESTAAEAAPAAASSLQSAEQVVADEEPREEEATVEEARDEQEERSDE
jgi:sec-independent protein translocase protein TatB